MSQNLYKDAPAPRWHETLLSRLFPVRMLKPKPCLAADEMVTNVGVRLSFADRLRVLVSGRCAVEVRIQTDKPVGRVGSRARFNVLPPARRRVGRA